MQQFPDVFGILEKKENKKKLKKVVDKSKFICYDLDKLRENKRTTVKRG